jgi:hypothetical protein
MTKFAHTDDENRWHAEIFYSLTQESVTPAELQEMTAQPPPAVGSLRHEKIRRILEQHGALGQLSELARRAGVVPEVLMDDKPDDDLKDALRRRQYLCAIDDLMAEGIVERKPWLGPRVFGLVEHTLH